MYSAVKIAIIIHDIRKNCIVSLVSFSVFSTINRILIAIAIESS